MKISRQGLRSLQGQLTLLALAYVGALLLALVALCCRSLFFERFLGETFRAASEDLAPLLQAAADGTARGPELLKLKNADGDVLYEAWMHDEQLDRQGRLARYLFSVQGDLILERARRTLAVGTREQKARALDLLGWTDSPELRREADRLGRRALERALRRGEDELGGRARDLLQKLSG
jgi:hypothetical protein